jgi:hypothetical protein
VFLKAAKTPRKANSPKNGLRWSTSLKNQKGQIPRRHNLQAISDALQCAYGMTCFYLKGDKNI